MLSTRLFVTLNYVKFEMIKEDHKNSSTQSFYVTIRKAPSLQFSNNGMLVVMLDKFYSVIF